MVDGVAPKIRRVLCPKCLCVLVEDPQIPVYKCGKCDAVLQAKYCKSGANLHNQAGANGNVNPGRTEITSCVTNRPLDGPKYGYVPSNFKTLFEMQHCSPMESVAEVNKLKGDIPMNDCNIASSVVDNLEAKIPCLDGRNACNSTLDAIHKERDMVAKADASTRLERERNTVTAKSHSIDLSANQSEIGTPKDEVTDLDRSSSGSSRQLSPEREIERPRRNDEHIFLDGSHTTNENISELENARDEALPGNMVANADACTGCLERDRDTVIAKSHTINESYDQFEIDIPKVEVPNLDRSSSGNSSQLSPEREINRPRRNYEHVSLNDSHTRNENICEWGNARAEAPPGNMLVANADSSAGCLEREKDTVTAKSHTIDVSSDQSEIDTPMNEVPNLDESSSGNSRQLSPEREIVRPRRNDEHVSLDDSHTRNENISELENARDEAPPGNSGSSSCNSEQLFPKVNGKTDNNKVRPEHTVLCDMLEESLNINRDISSPVRSEKNADHLESAHPNSKEYDTDIREIGNSDVNLIWNPPCIVHHAYDASVSSFEDGFDTHFPSQYDLTSRRTFRSQRASKLPRTRVDETNDSFISVETKKASHAWLPENTVPPRFKQRHSSETVASFMSDGDEVPVRIGLDHSSEEFYSAHNWTETEKDNLSLRNLSRGSQFSSSPVTERLELLKKIDELRDQLARSHDQWDKRPPHFNINKRSGSRQSRSGGSASEQEIHRFPSIQSHLDPYRSRNSMLVGHQHQVLPSSAQSDPSWHCRPGHNLQDDGQLPAATYCSSELCGLYCHICSQSGNLQCHLHSHYLPPKYSRDIGNLHHKKEQSKKRHYRPVLGGANLITCYECLKVLQIPEDFHFSRKRCNKLRCGDCSKVLSLALVNKNQIVPYVLALQLQLPTGGGNTARSHVSTRNGIHVPPGNHGFHQRRGDQVSCSNDFGPSFDRSGEIEDEHVQYVSRDSLDSSTERDIGKPPLHSLMGYISASEIIYNH